jgi:hypothetical protein
LGDLFLHILKHSKTALTGHTIEKVMIFSSEWHTNLHKTRQNPKARYLRVENSLHKAS